MHSYLVKVSLFGIKFAQTDFDLHYSKIVFVKDKEAAKEYVLNLDYPLECEDKKGRPYNCTRTIKALVSKADSHSIAVFKVKK